MEKSHEKIANIKIIFSDSCTELQKEIIQDYWSFNNYENSPKKCRIKYNLTGYELTTIIKDLSTLSFYVKCDNCNSYEKNEAKSITSFKGVLSRNNYTCDYCYREERIKKEKIQAEKNLILKAKFIGAIENKNWQNLSKFELNVLIKSLDLNNSELRTYFWDVLGQKDFIKIIKALESIERQNLIILERNYKNYITEHKHLSRLLNCKEELINAYKNYESKADFNYETNELKLKLTINDSIIYPDSPLYAGTIIFKERIVIEPNTEYVFGQWTRSNDNLYFTLVPLNTLERLPEQKSISNQPKLVKEIIADFFKNFKH